MEKRYKLSLEIKYELDDEGDLKGVKLVSQEGDADFEGVVFSIFALLGHVDQFVDPPEEGVSEEEKEQIFWDKQVLIRAVLSGVMNYINVLNSKVKGQVPMHQYAEWASKIGDVAVALCATACGVDPDAYEELFDEFYETYIKNGNTIENPKERQDDQDSENAPRNFI